MTAAMWGAAWSQPKVLLRRLAKALQNAPDSFWQGAARLRVRLSCIVAQHVHTLLMCFALLEYISILSAKPCSNIRWRLRAGTVPQNASNLLWALSTMRFRPGPEFAARLQAVLLEGLRDEPDSIHPQNIGDVVQALAVLRLEPIEGLEEACDKWMRNHVQLLLPNHILSYLNVRPGLNLPRLHRRRAPRTLSRRLAKDGQHLDAPRYRLRTATRQAPLLLRHATKAHTHHVQPSTLLTERRRCRASR
jgi:hypothetical protein